jgi:preprotein translocase subunit SecB
MSYKIIGKYIKKLSFEIPNTKAFFFLSKDISNYKINIDIKSSQVKESIIEIQTKLFLTPIKENFEKIDTQIEYSTVVQLDNELDKEEIKKIILVKIPTKIYPEIRKIFVFLFENSGFKDVKINEVVDFEKLYKLKSVQ